jgi:hypothetical protein
VITCESEVSFRLDPAREMEWDRKQIFLFGTGFRSELCIMMDLVVLRFHKYGQIRAGG